VTGVHQCALPMCLVVWSQLSLFKVAPPPPPPRRRHSLLWCGLCCVVCRSVSLIIQFGISSGKRVCDVFAAIHTGRNGRGKEKTIVGKTFWQELLMENEYDQWYVFWCIKLHTTTL
jgi:hypothetical protein